MSNSLLYHAVGIRGYEHVRAENGSEGIRTLSISRSKRERSASYLPSQFQFRGLESNCI